MKKKCLILFLCFFLPVSTSVTFTNPFVSFIFKIVNALLIFYNFFVTVTVGWSFPTDSLDNISFLGYIDIGSFLFHNLFSVCTMKPCSKIEAAFDFAVTV